MSLVHPALLRLHVFALKGQLRRIVRGVRTPKGALFSAVGALVGLSWIGGWAIPMFGASKSEDAIPPGLVTTFVTLFLMVHVVLAAVQGGFRGGFVFSPAELQFLLPGPFSRRELLMHKIVYWVLASFLFAIPMSLFATMLASAPLSKAYPVLVLLVFNVLAVEAVVLQCLHRVGRSAFLKGVGVLGVAAVGIVLWPLATQVRAGGFLDLATSIWDSTPFQVVSAPFRLFPEMLFEKSTERMIGLAAIALGMNAALVLLVLLIDTDFYEASVVRSEKQHAALERFRGRRMAVRTATLPRYSRLPAFPRFEGAGPICRRQLIAALRANSLTRLLLLVFPASIGIGFLIRSQFADRANSLSASVTVVDPVFLVLTASTLYVTVLFSEMCPFDFRGEIDRMDQLKSLPIPPQWIAAGEIASSVIAITCLEIASVLPALVVLSLYKPFLFTIAFLPLLNAIILGVDNMLFLVFPIRLVAANPGDIQRMGKMIIRFIVKGILFLPAFGIPVGLAAALVYFDLPAFAVAAALWLTLLAVAVTLVLATAFAFARFDPTVDIAD